MNTLLNKIRLKVLPNETQADFAVRLGISEGMWSMILTGKRGIGDTVCRRIVEVFPDLRDDVIAYMLDNKNTETEQNAES